MHVCVVLTASTTSVLEEGIEEALNLHEYLTVLNQKFNFAVDQNLNIPNSMKTVTGTNQVLSKSWKQFHTLPGSIH